MDWVLVVVIVPLVVVPIVLVFGFAGCATILGLDDVTYRPVAPDAPFDLVATALGTAHIRLDWKHKSPASVTFRVERDGPGGRKTFNAGTALMFDDQGSPNLQDGVWYTYTVVAQIASGSATSNGAQARTWKWERAFAFQLTNRDNVLAASTLVQRIPKSAYSSFTGSRVVRVRLTLRGPVNNNPAVGLPLGEVTLGHAVGKRQEQLNPDPNDWDSSSSMVKFGPHTLPGSGKALLLPERDFNLDRARDLIVAFDIGANRTGLQVTVVAGAQAWLNPLLLNEPAEAGKSDRTGGNTVYPPRPAGFVYLVESIDVLTAA